MCLKKIILGNGGIVGRENKSGIEMRTGAKGHFKRGKLQVLQEM